MAVKSKKNKVKKTKNIQKEIRKDLKKICSVVASIIILVLIIIFFPCTNKNTKITLQIIEHDNHENITKVIKEIKVKEDEVIKLDEYNGNDIKIKSINDKNVLVSREVLKYEIISQNNKYNGEAIDYMQTVIEKIEYNTVFALNIDERNPFGPEYAQPRYHYNAKFVK